MTLGFQINSEVYRGLIRECDLISSRVLVKQTDLMVSGFKDLTKEATALVHHYRRQIEEYIDNNPHFTRALFPVKPDPFAPKIIVSMIEAASKAGVGPMAAVAGAIAENVGSDLLSLSRDIIVENGGDVFIRSQRKREILLLAESSNFFGQKVAIKAWPEPLGVCTSSGRLGHSLSFGKADAVMVVDNSAVMADAMATGIANQIKKESDIKIGIRMAQETGALGVLILVEGQMGAWGQIELVS